MIWHLCDFAHLLFCFFVIVQICDYTSFVIVYCVILHCVRVLVCVSAFFLCVDSHLRVWLCLCVCVRDCAIKSVTVRVRDEEREGMNNGNNYLIHLHR